MVRWLRPLAVAPVLVAMIAMGGLVLGRVYHGPLLAGLVLGAGLGAVAVSAALRRAPAWSVAPVSVLALAGYLTFAARISAAQADVPGDLLDVTSDALRNGIPRLLTAMIPVEPQPDTVVVPVVAAWLAGLGGAELALRAGRTLLGYVPVTLWYLGALYAVGPNAAPAVRTTLAYAGLSAVGLALTARSGPAAPVALPGPARTALRVRTAAGAAAGLAAVLTLAAVFGPPVAGRVDTAPVDPRRYVQPPQLAALDENPLVRISGWALAPRQQLFRVRLTEPGAPTAGGPGPAGGTAPADGARPADRAGPAEPPRIRLAVLSDYDGVTWRVGGNYRSAGRVLPEVAGAPGAGEPADAVRREVRQEITVVELSGRLLPAVPAPRRVEGVRVAYDPRTGMLIRPTGLTPGLRYTVTSVHPRPDVNLLAGAQVPGGPAVERFLALGAQLPDDIARLARQLGAEQGGAYQRAQAVEQFLAAHYRLVADAPSGHAYPNLSFFLFGPRHAGGQRGTSEQFTAAFAVLARALGLPTRVVVGFRVDPASGGQVRAGDALAWPEVLFDGLGWVPFHPLPERNARPRPVEEDFRPKPETSAPPQSRAPTPSAEPSPSGSAGAPPAAGPQGSGTGLLRWAGSVLLGLLLCATGGYLAGVPLLRRAQRRRRLNAADPAARVAGAWLEVTDALRLAGRPAGAHLSATEVAAYAVRATGSGAAHRRGGHRDEPALTPPGGRGPRPAVPGGPADPTALDELAGLVNSAVFAPVGALDPQRAAVACDRALTYVAQLRAGRPWWSRARWSLHPGPLRWHRFGRSGRPGRPGRPPGAGP